jgi:hypothetical protein
MIVLLWAFGHLFYMLICLITSLIISLFEFKLYSMMTIFVGDLGNSCHNVRG